jgi:hypothetical protein
MKPAVKLALAYVYASGNKPNKLHLPTLMALHDYCEMIDDMNERISSGRFYRLNAEGLAAIASHPLKLAADWFTSRGFKAESNSRRRTSHYVRFERDGMEGLAYRSGGGSVTVSHSEVPYRTSFQLEEAEAVWPAILRPAFYAGERLPDETGRDHLQRAIAAYQTKESN